jgi:hypothetical protein
MAREHERWIVELFGGLSRAEIQQLHALLGKLRAHLTRLQSGAEETT